MKRKLKKILPYFFIGLALHWVDICICQNIEQSVQSFKERLDEDPIQITGGLSANVFWNAINNPAMRRDDPFNASLFGQLNFDILGIQAPFSIALSDGNATYSLPAYSFVGLSPSYRWAKLHLFQRSMSFSKYTLNGLGFNGIGMELTPGNWHISGMAGRLRKARQEDFGLRNELDPFYRRMGYGGRIGYKKNKDALFLSFFKASDDEDSLNLPDSLGIRPQENVVISAEAAKKISDVLFLEAEYAYSIMTPDKNYFDRVLSIRQDDFAKNFMNINGTTRYSSAYNFGVTFTPIKDNTIHLTYERINPLFRSLGSLIYQNDFENITIGYRGRVRKKVNLNVRGGLQRNNLNNQEVEDRVRWVGSANVGIPFSATWSTQLAYTNFSQTTRLIDRSDPFAIVDSVFLGSTNTQWSIQSQYILNKNQLLSAMASFQNVNTIQNEVISSNTNVIRTYSLIYSYRRLKEVFNFSAAILYTQFRQSEILTNTFSPTLTLEYVPSNQLKMNLSLSLNAVSLNRMSNGNIMRLTQNTTYQINDRQNIGLRMQLLNRNQLNRSFTEFLGSLNYGYNF